MKILNPKFLFLTLIFVVSADLALASRLGPVPEDPKISSYQTSAISTIIDPLCEECVKNYNDTGPSYKLYLEHSSIIFGPSYKSADKSIDD